MGYDVSYHPVDPAFFRDQLFPIIRGERSGDDLFDRAARIAKVRFIANAWGLAVSGVASDDFPSRLAAQAESEARKPGLLGRLFGKKPPAASPTPSLVGAFDSDLHIWGRPFFVVADSADEISRLVDRYLDADASSAAEIARQAVRALNPALLDGARAPGDDARPFQEHLEEQLAGLPDDGDFAHSVRWKIDLFRDAYAALGTSRKIADPDGGEHDPEELFATDFATAALELAAVLRPGWMDRGTVWPTHLMTEAGLDPSPFFQLADPLFAPLLDRVPRIRQKYDTTITENFMLGGYVPADRVPALIDHVTANVRRLADVYDKDAPEQVPMYLRKLIEALRDAARRGLAFIEATEIYSGPLGKMN